MLIIFEISLFGEDYALSADEAADGVFFPTYDTDLTLSTELLPPVSLLLPAIFLGDVRGLPLDEFAVSDGKRNATVMRAGGCYLLPINKPKAQSCRVKLEDAGSDVDFISYHEFNKNFLILRCDDLSLFDKRLAPRLITKASHDVFIAYEKTGDGGEFFAFSRSIKKGLLPTSACVLNSLLGIRNLSSGKQSFDFKYLSGKPCLVVKRL